MEITNAKKKHLRSISHSLKPVVTVAEKGLSEGVHAEVDRALNDHELIKVKININDPQSRKELATSLCSHHKATNVQMIGKILVMYRLAKTPNPKLSNLQNRTS